jgi:hypothetical protein
MINTRGVTTSPEYAPLVYSRLYMHVENNLVYGGCNIYNLLDQNETIIQHHGCTLLYP